MSTTSVTSATIPGLAVPIPDPGVWTIDPSHSSIEVTVRHLMAAKVRARFADFSGEVTIADDPLESSVAVDIQTASIDSHVTDRDAHLRSGDFFAAEDYPTATFRSTSLRHEGDDRFTLEGELTIRGVTRPVDLALSYHGLVTDPWGNQRIALSATGDVNREEFGLTWNQALEAGGVLVGKTARIDIDVQAVQQV